MINQHDQETDIGKFIQFINRIKEHRHNKIKNKQINKFECLYFKRFGYHHNFSKSLQFFKNTNTTHRALSGQSNVPYCISTPSSSSSSIPAVPATPMASTLSSSIDPAPAAPTTAPRQSSSSSRHTCKTDDCTQKVGNQPFQDPPYSRSSYLFYKKDSILP